jgi:hypothetical protein
MSDFLDRLISNEHGTEPAFMPRVPARFETDRSQQEPLESVVETFATRDSAPSHDVRDVAPPSVARLAANTLETRSHETRIDRMTEVIRQSDRTVMRVEPQANVTKTSPLPTIHPEKISVARLPRHEEVAPRREVARTSEEPALVPRMRMSDDTHAQPLARIATSEQPNTQAAQISAEPIVQISIGRLEVRAAATTESPRRRAVAAPTSHLERYLEGRNRGRGK